VTAPMIPRQRPPDLMHHERDVTMRQASVPGIDMRQNGIEREDLGGGDSDLEEIVPIRPVEEAEWPLPEERGAEDVQREDKRFEPQAPDEERAIQSE